MKVLPDELIKEIGRFLEEKKTGNVQINIKRGRINWVNVTEHFLDFREKPKLTGAAQGSSVKSESEA